MWFDWGPREVQPQRSTITLHFDPGPLPTYLLPESLWRATHWPGYLTMLFEVLALGAERERRGESDGEIDVKRRAESEKDCSGRGNRGLNSDEIIQFVSWQNRQTERWAATTEQQPPGDLQLFHKRPRLVDYKVILSHCLLFIISNDTVFEHIVYDNFTSRWNAQTARETEKKHTNRTLFLIQFSIQTDRRISILNIQHWSQWRVNCSCKQSPHSFKKDIY